MPLTTPSGSPQTISVRLGQSNLYLIISDLLCDFNCIHLITGSHILRVGLRLSFSANFEIWAIMRFLGGHTLWPSCQLSRLHKIVYCFIVQLPTFCLMKNSLLSSPAIGFLPWTILTLGGFSPSCSVSSFWPGVVGEGLWKGLGVGATYSEEAPSHSHHLCESAGSCLKVWQIFSFSPLCQFFLPVCKGWKQLKSCFLFTEGLISFWGVVNLDLFP